MNEVGLAMDEGEGRSALVVRALGVRFGGLVALDDVNIEVSPGEVLGIIGPNGAGKTTLFNCISGHVRPSSGSVLMNGRDVTGEPPYRMAKFGLARTFQNLEMFGKMSALETVMVGAHLHGRSGSVVAMLRLPRHWREERLLAREAMEALERTGVAHLAGRPANELPYGQQRRVEIARAVVAKPKVLALDEPAAGLSGEEAEELVSLIKELASSSLAVLLVEHNMRALMVAADRVTVLDSGRQIASGLPEEVRTNPDVVAAYLGVSGRAES